MKHQVESEAVVEELSGGMKVTFEADITRYELYALPVKNFGLEMLGHVEDGFLVVNGLTRMAYLFNAKGYLALSYIAAKLFPRDWDSIYDVENVSYALSKILTGRSFMPYERHE